MRKWLSMVTTTINRKPYTATRKWNVSPDGSVDLSFGDNKNKLTFQTFRDSNITISSRYKSEKTSISIRRDALSSVEVNTKTYPIWLVIGTIILIYSLFYIGPELETIEYCTNNADQDIDLSDPYCDDYIPFIPQFSGLFWWFFFFIIYVVTKRGRIILRVQSDADFRILVSSSAIPSQQQMRGLVDALLFIPTQTANLRTTGISNSPYQVKIQSQQVYATTKPLPKPMPPKNYKHG